MLDANDKLSAVREVLWESLEGGNYDLEAMKKVVHDDAHFVRELGIDSLDLIEFYLRIEDLFKVKLSEDDYGNLASISAIGAFLENRNATSSPKERHTSRGDSS